MTEYALIDDPEGKPVTIVEMETLHSILATDVRTVNGKTYTTPVFRDEAIAERVADLLNTGEIEWEYKVVRRRRHKVGAYWSEDSGWAEQELVQKYFDTCRKNDDGFFDYKMIKRRKAGKAVDA